MLERLELLIGKENIEKIQKQNILVIGLGGVGGYVTESLIRSGILNITIVDFDKVDKTNLNRQILSLNSTLGEYKVNVCYDRIKDINKDCNVKVIREFINEDNIDLLFKEDYTYIIDCCDFIPCKKLIINNCILKKIPFITCCGTGKRMAPEKLMITDLRKTCNDPIARILRKYVKDSNIKGKINVLCSKELPIKTEGSTIASNAFVPASAGLLITSYVIRDVIGFSVK